MKTFNCEWTQMNANVKCGTGFQPVCMLIGIFIFGCVTASAQTTQELFNPAAREYIVGNTAVASNLVSSALIKYPTDEKLQKLKELIEQQQQQQDQDQQQQQDQDKKDQDKKDQDKKDQQKQQDQKNQDQQNQDQQEQQDQEQQDQQEQDQQEQQDQDKEPQEAQPSQTQQQAGQMSEEEAQQLLDSMKQNEKDQRTDLRPYLGQPVRVDKDW